jgi:hypothetical protein
LAGERKMKLIDIINKLSTARMEYQTSTGSVLNKFVVPFFIDRLDLRKISHSIALVGSRGSGKSTYIQYFSHSTRFDCDLNSIEDNEFDCILFYWKPDIAYCQGLRSNWLGEDALRFFSLHTALSLIDELSKFIRNVSYHFPDVLESINSNNNFWSSISYVTKTNISCIQDLNSWVMNYKYEISTRLNPVNTDGLLSIEPKQMLDYLLKSLRMDCIRFAKTTFKVFIDEFELLTLEQQKLINTYRKESNSQLNWNVAYKFNAKPTNETTSNQWLQSPDDYTEVELDGFIESNFRVFAAEIFILTLQNAGLNCHSNIITPSFLGSRENIEQRKTLSYQNVLFSLIQGILPTPSIRELSIQCLSHNSVKNKLKNLFDQYRFSDQHKKLFLEDPSLSITLIGTYRQKSFDINLFKKYVEGSLGTEDSRKIKDKISTFEYNTLLSLNLQNASIQTSLYAGFERFITMSTPNIRHFKELCLNALKFSDDIESDAVFEFIEDIKTISSHGMHQGAISTSADLVKEVISYPPHGNKLSQMVNRIGELFRISQKSSYQSEPERVIFTIIYDYAGSDQELENFLYSALSWRVIVEDESRRIKDDIQITSKEFQLNPIYSPRFGISYRKKRGISLTLQQFKSLVTGTSEEFEKIRLQYQHKWRADDSNDDAKQGVLL